MNTMSAPATAGAFAPLRIGVHAVIAVGVAVVSPFTALAWPFALAVGMLLGSADASRMRGEPDRLADAFATALLAAFGVLGMLFFGAFVGGLIAIPVAALAAFSEKAAAHASPIDRGVVRIVLFVVPLVMWLVVLPLLGMNVSLRFGE